MQSTAPTPKTLPLILLFLLGSLIAALADWFIAGDWLCGIISCALLGGIATIILSSLTALIQRRRCRQNPTLRPWCRKHQLIFLLILTTTFAALSLWLAAALKTDIFEAAFACPPPASITDLAADRHFAGGPGDTICFLHFHASRETLTQIISHRPLTKSNDEISNYLSGEETWPKFWNRIIGHWATSYHPTWTIPTMKQPELYHWSNNDPATSHQATYLLWDPTTQEAYAIFLAG